MVFLRIGRLFLKYIVLFGVIIVIRLPPGFLDMRDEGRLLGCFNFLKTSILKKEWNMDRSFEGSRVPRDLP